MASAFVVMEILMYSSLTSAGVWVAVVSSFVVMPTSSIVAPVKVMFSSFAVMAGATVASSLFKVVASSSFAVVAGVTVAPSLFNVVAGGDAALDAGANAFSFPLPPP